ncbi:MAG: hypothetical protein V4631_21840 [Pseudomonadota bacterium]
MSARCAGWMLGALLIAPACAQAAIFSHVDPGSGLTILSNVDAGRAETVKKLAPTPTQAARAAAAATPADFPRVSAARQRERDGGRRAILMAELAGEQQALGTAAAARAQADVLHRHQANIAALQRELNATH